MTDMDLVELESPPDIVASCFPRFAEALTRGAAALRKRNDDHAKLREELSTCKAQLAAVLEAVGAATVDEALAKLNGDATGNEVELCYLCHEAEAASDDGLCARCRKHLSTLSPRTKKANRPGGGNNHGWLATRRQERGY